MRTQSETQGGLPGEGREYALLVELARVKLEEPERNRAGELLGRPLNWGYLAALARYHGVAPLVYYHLNQQFEGQVPAEALRLLHQHVHAQAASSLYLVNELRVLGALLEEEGIPAISVKGISLAQDIYGSLALRPFVDIDLLIRRSDFERLEVRLVASGFQHVAMGSWQKRLYLLVHAQYTFWRPAVPGQRGLVSVLDVHTALLPPGYSYEEDFEVLLGRSAPMESGGGHIHALGPEDLLIVLCYHGFKNRWDRLKHICDVAELVRTRSDLAWDTVLRRARSMHSQRVLGLGLYLAAEVLDVSLPPGPVGRLVEEHWVQRLGAGILQRLPQQAHMSVEPYLDRVQLNVFGQDSARGGLRYGAYSLARRAAELVLRGER